MAAEFASGLFALGGVALAAVFGEVRARREFRARESAEQIALRRKLYGVALQRVELVASRCAHWINAKPDDKAEARREFWETLTTGYQTLNEIRLVSETQDPGDAMKRILETYRDAVESDHKSLPKPTELRHAMINTFRHDLGLRKSGSLELEQA